MLNGRNIICLASSHWDSPTWVNCQHIMSRLAGRNRVLYVEPASLRFPSARGADMGKLLYRLTAWTRKERMVRENLWVYAPIMIPLHRYAIVRAFNRFVLRTSLGRIAGRLGLADPLLWIFLPTGVDLVGAFGEDLVIYHCVDSYSANPGVDPDVIDALEKRLLARADLVLTTSGPLYESKKEFNPRTICLPNVADTAFFMRAIEDGVAVPEYIGRIPAPRVVFTGAISGYKVDTGLIAYCARQLPGVSFVLIGPAGSGDPGTDIRSLEAAGNIFLTGPKPYGELPACLKGAAACMIPFRINDTTSNVFPMKFFEYMASGKPVVTTALPALDEFREYCYIAHDGAGFVSSIRAALAGDADGGRNRRLELARRYSWEGRMEELSMAIERMPGRRTGNKSGGAGKPETLNPAGSAGRRNGEKRR